MATDRSNDLRAFIDFATASFESVEGDVTLDEALARWEHENAPEAEREVTIRAIQLGLDDMHAGRTADAFEFAERMRRQITGASER